MRILNYSDTQKMKRLLLFSLLLFNLGSAAFAQKMNGYGGELTIVGFNANARFWTSKNHGFEVLGGMASGLEDFKLDDVAAGFKYLHTIQYRRQDRTYFGVVGKWRWIDVFDSNRTTSLPVGGIFVGKEWYTKRIHRKSYAIEIGYQYGKKEYEIYSPVNNYPIEKVQFQEFPLIVNLRYSFYQLR
jgi:hypothetical protein